MFLETICINRSIVQNLHAHLNRMYNSARAFDIQAPPLPDLIALLPAELKNKKVRCSITYDSHILDIRFIDYTPRTINSLRLVESDINYAHKFSDRQSLNNLLEQRNGCDEVLIVQNNCITDTTYSNVVFSNAAGRLFTPDTYLLNGTKRQLLLLKGIISETRITSGDLHLYDKVYLINAMLDVEDRVGTDVKNIIMK